MELLSGDAVGDRHDRIAGVGQRGPGATAELGRDRSARTGAIDRPARGHLDVEGEIDCLHEATLRGAPATEAAFRRAAETELADAQPLPGNAFKVPLARNLIVRTLLDLLQTPEEARP